MKIKEFGKENSIKRNVAAYISLPGEKTDDGDLELKSMTKEKAKQWVIEHPDDLLDTVEWYLNAIDKYYKK